ncbi:hypothetical protein H634G_04323 [Metarhizium anisopliae BRIP 53293]|uniref:Cytochrome b5 heme-binding domain-containing protein n=1 Tax=Metarhizium anisopliae BRIP 53293 TaxID=1291518 RepID=A0A0D9P1I5_METAN|nr:hypothetical protein H634G_04323 [Metarhizium anisopliae BRIP 53293]
MGLLGISFIVASVIYVIIRPPGWLAHMLLQWRPSGGVIADTPTRQKRIQDDTAPRIQEDALSIEEPLHSLNSLAKKATPAESKQLKDAAVMPPSPPQSVIELPTLMIDEPEGSTTPKAMATKPSDPVPSFSLSPEPTTSSKSSSSMMPPPPLPARLSAGRMPTLPQFPAPNSAQRARGPVPNRGPPGLSVPSAGLTPPPTHSSKPQKPSRKVLLDPGHSPLDWARISGPNADLRGVEPSTPYLRVTPSMLRKQTGRKGKDAWMALNGKVYNITPYAKFHPGGIPELMRGAARDGTKLFGEIHPWVNYETMLSACLVGLLVEEPDDGSQESEMDKMD